MKSKIIYPVTIIQDRYTGTYSHGKYTAWNMEFFSVPKEIESDDATCMNFWEDFRNKELVLYNEFNEQVYVGLGVTPDKALQNLIEQLQYDE